MIIISSLMFLGTAGDSWTSTAPGLVILDDAGEEEAAEDGGGGADGLFWLGNLCLIVPARAFFLVG